MRERKRKRKSERSKERERWEKKESRRKERMPEKEKEKERKKERKKDKGEGGYKKGERGKADRKERGETGKYKKRDGERGDSTLREGEGEASGSYCGSLANLSGRSQIGEACLGRRRCGWVSNCDGVLRLNYGTAVINRSTCATRCWLVGQRIVDPFR